CPWPATSAFTSYCRFGHVRQCWQKLTVSSNTLIVKSKGSSMTANREALAGALRHARENRGMSQQAVADILGLSRTVIAQIELGNRLVSADELGQFATLYETSISDLTGRDQAGDLETMAFEWAPDLFEDDKARAVVKRVLALLEMASSLERLL